MLMNFLFAILVLFAASNIGQTASTHKHTHAVNKERAEDGVYNSRDAHHYDGGDHHTEFDHEAILGSVKDATEFESLSPEESKERLAVLVTKMDTNSDGFVDRHELKAWILRSFKSLSEEEAADRFEDVDTNRDDQIAWEEYLLETFGMEQEDENGKRMVLDDAHSEEEKKLIADDKEMFAAADTDRNGYLSPEEFIKFVSPEEHPEMLPVILRQTLNDKDKNGDAKIDFKEFVGEMAKDHDKEWLIGEKEKFDLDYDLDGDGYLNGNEILAWIVPSNEDVAFDEMDHLFVASDEDHDDRLSYQEIINNYDTFVGSEATDYGEHLQNINHFEDEL